MNDYVYDELVGLTDYMNSIGVEHRDFDRVSVMVDALRWVLTPDRYIAPTRVAKLGSLERVMHQPRWDYGVESQKSD